VDADLSRDTADRYYETMRDGKTYVFTSATARDRFNNGDASVKLVVRTAPNGDSYWVEADNADTLSRQFNRAHPAR